MTPLPWQLRDALEGGLAPRRTRQDRVACDRTRFLVRRSMFSSAEGQHHEAGGAYRFHPMVKGVDPQPAHAPSRDLSLLDVTAPFARINAPRAARAGAFRRPSWR